MREHSPPTKAQQPQPLLDHPPQEERIADEGAVIEAAGFDYEPAQPLRAVVARWRVIQRGEQCLYASREYLRSPNACNSTSVTKSGLLIKYRFHRRRGSKRRKTTRCLQATWFDAAIPPDRRGALCPR